MSTLDEKLSQDVPTPGRATCWLGRHLKYLTPRVLESDALGPVRVEVTRMQRREVWRRVRRQDGDTLVELVETGAP